MSLKRRSAVGFYSVCPCVAALLIQCVLLYLLFLLNTDPVMHTNRSFNYTARWEQTCTLDKLHYWGFERKENIIFEMSHGISAC